MPTFTHPGGNPLEFAACRYASQGWPVFPVHMAEGKKLPHIREWPDKATVSHGQIRGWWKKWPDAGIGVVTGHRSKVIVLDVDGEQGRESLARLVSKHGPLPLTLQSVTGREDGGTHYWFSTDADIRNSTGKLGLGLDVRGEGGQVVVAPTFNPRTGKTYAWLDESADPAPLPDWLVAATQKPADRPEPPSQRRISTDSKTYAQAALERELWEVRNEPERTRNNVLNIKAGNLARFFFGGYLEEEDVQAQLTQVALEIGLDAGEVKDSISSGFKYGKTRPLTLISGEVLAARTWDWPDPDSLVHVE